jgi:hypothetical protein
MGMPLFVLSILFVFLACPVHAGEISVLGGYGVTTQPVQSTGVWQVQYMEGLGENFAYTLSYVNQGHFITHHRDGTAAALWFRTNRVHRQLSLGVGAGPMFYFDTRLPPEGPPADIHGWATIVNLQASWYATNRLIYQLQGSWVRGGSSFDTGSVLVGIGYQLDAPPIPGPDLKATRQTEETTDNELTLLGGQTVVNLPGNGSSTAGSISYRRGIWRYLEWTAGALYEGKSDLIDRYGLTTQLWLAKNFFAERVALGVGFGFYLADDRRSDQHSGAFWSEILSITASYRLSPRWCIRGTWDRIITYYDRDSDIFLGGIGYRF